LVEGANERGEVGEQGAGLKRGAGTRTCPENARTWAHPRQGDRGREVEDELTGGDGGTEREGERERERERERARVWETAPTGRPHRAAREREREGGEVSALGSAPTGGARLSGTGVRERARGLGLVGRLGLNWVFLFLGIF
jgi:hypothetical protein